MLSALSQTEQRELRRFFTPTLGVIANAIGIGNTLRLVDEYGGCVLSVPDRFKPEHRLVMAIGMNNAKALKRLLLDGGLGDGVRKIDLPSGSSIRKAILRQKVQRAVAEGMSKARVARAFGLTNRGVRRMCNAS